MDYFKSAVDQPDLVFRKLKVHRFYWHDHMMIDSDGESIKAMKDQLSERGLFPQFYKGMFSGVANWHYLGLLLIVLGILMYVIIPIVIGYTKNVLLAAFDSIGGVILLSVSVYFVYNVLKPRPAVRQLMMFDDLGWLSIWIEELIKEVPGGIEFVGAVERIKYGSWANYYAHRSISGRFMERIHKHYMLNTLLLQAYKGQIGSTNLEGLVRWVEENKMPNLDPSSIVSVMHMRNIRCENVPLPENTWEVCLTELPPRGVGQLKGKLPDWFSEDVKYSIGTFPLLFCSSYLTRPAGTASNLKTAIHGRLNVEVPRPHRNAVGQMRWMLHSFIPLTDPNTILDAEQEQHWRDSLSAKQKKDILKDRKRYGDGEPSEVSVSGKFDELLIDKSKFEEHIENQCFTPRVLFNLSGWWLDKMGWSVECLTRSLAEKFNFRGDGKIIFPNVGKNGYRVYVPYFTCGATASQLSHFFTLASQAPKDEFWFMVMGDDMASAVSESDFSKYDRTQDKTFIEALINYCDGDVNLKQFADIWRLQYRLPRVALHKKTGKRFTVKKETGAMTGQTPTCWANSVFNILSTINAHHYFDNPEVGYAHWGFQAKYKKTEFVTFLKGVFLRNVVGGFTWVRLPSFIGKFGKTLTNWMYHVPNRRSVSEKAAYMLWSQMLGYGNMENTSFHVTFKKIVKDLCSSITELPGKEEKVKLEFWQVYDDMTVEVLDTVWDRFLLTRYNLDEFAVKEFFHALTSINYLPAVYTSRFVDALVLADYG